MFCDEEKRCFIEVMDYYFEDIAFEKLEEMFSNVMFDADFGDEPYPTPIYTPYSSKQTELLIHYCQDQDVYWTFINNERYESTSYETCLGLLLDHLETQQMHEEYLKGKIKSKIKKKESSL